MEMALIKSVNNKQPEFGDNNFLAENCTVLGDVITGNDCSIWYTAVIRGDVNAIRIGNSVNIQDGAVLHGTYERSDTIIGSYVTVGHRAIVHGCTVEDNVLIGMGAIVMDDALIGANSIVAAGAVVLAGMQVPPGSLVGGVPAKVIGEAAKTLSPDQLTAIAGAYVKYSSWYK